MADTDPIWPRTGLYIRRKNGDHFYAALLPDEATIAISVDELAEKTGVFNNAIAHTDDGSVWLWDEDSIAVADGSTVLGSGEVGRWILAGGNGNATKLQGLAVSANAPGAGDVLVWDADTQEWTPQPQSSGGGGGNQLMPVLKSSADSPYNAQPWDMIFGDPNDGNLIVVLPDTAANGDQIGVAFDNEQAGLGPWSNIIVTGRPDRDDYIVAAGATLFGVTFMWAHGRWQVISTNNTSGDSGGA
jgi:hypothetical protein